MPLVSIANSYKTTDKTNSFSAMKFPDWLKCQSTGKAGIMHSSLLLDLVTSTILVNTAHAHSILGVGISFLAANLGWLGWICFGGLVTRLSWLKHSLQQKKKEAIWTISAVERVYISIYNRRCSPSFNLRLSIPNDVLQLWRKFLSKICETKSGIEGKLVFP